MPSIRRRRWSRSRTRTTAPAAWSFTQDEARARLRARRASAASRRILDGARLWNAAVATRAVGRRARRAVRSRRGRRSRKASARPAARCSPGRASVIARGHPCIAACSAARCGRSASSPPPALYALDHHLERLADDHANARLIAEALGGLPQVDLDLATVQTNIVVFNLREAADRRGAVVEARARARRAGRRVRPAHGPRGDAPGRDARAVRARGGNSCGGRCESTITSTLRVVPCDVVSVLLPPSATAHRPAATRGAPA